MVSVQSNFTAVPNLVKVLNAKNPNHQLVITCHNYPTNHVDIGDLEAVTAFKKLTNQ